MGRVVEFSRAIGPHAPKPLWRHVLGEVLRGERLDHIGAVLQMGAQGRLPVQVLALAVSLAVEPKDRAARGRDTAFMHP